MVRCVFDPSYMEETFGEVCGKGRFSCIGEIMNDGMMKA